MSGPVASEDLEAIVKRRTRELRAERVRYSEAVTLLADELYQNERGKETRIGQLGASPGLLGPRLGLADSDLSLVAKTKKGKAKALSSIERLVSPWMADVFEDG